MDICTYASEQFVLCLFVCCCCCCSFVRLLPESRWISLVISWLFPHFAFFRIFSHRKGVLFVFFLSAYFFDISFQCRTKKQKKSMKKKNKKETLKYVCNFTSFKTVFVRSFCRGGSCNSIWTFCDLMKTQKKSHRQQQQQQQQNSQHFTVISR